MAKLLRPGDDCPKCGKMLTPHCVTKKCQWLVCVDCGAYGHQTKPDKFVK